MLFKSIISKIQSVQWYLSVQANIFKKGANSVSRLTDSAETETLNN